MTKKECGCEITQSECEKKGKECYLMHIDGYLSCSVCGRQPNSEVDDLCKCDFE